MRYDVLVLPSAEKELAAIPARDLARILKRIELLSENPRPQGVQKLKGTKDQFRIRQGEFRMLFRIDEARKRVFVYAVGNRRDVYR